MRDPIETDETEVADPWRSATTIDAAVWRIAERVRRKRIPTPWRMRAVKHFSITVLLTTAFFWLYAMDFHYLTRSLVALGALAVMLQAVNTGSYGLAVVFAAMAVLYNPIVPLFAFSGLQNLLIVLASTVPFAISLRWMKTTLAERDRMSGTEGI